MGSVCVSLYVIINSVRSVQQRNKCDNYQRAAQALVVDTRLHLLFDDTRHEGTNEMKYDVEDDTGSSDSDMSISDDEYDDDEDNNGEDNDCELNDGIPDVVFAQSMEVDEEIGLAVEEEDLCYTDEVGEEDNSDEANLSAYVINDASQPTEQGGVLHVVHGWIQQAQPEKVSCPYVSAHTC